MAEKINLATLDLDIQGLLLSAEQSKKAIQSVREEQKALKKAGEESSPQFIRNEVELKNLTSAYRLQTTAIQAQVSEGGRLQNSQMAIAEATGRLNQSENEYRANNTLLLKLRKDLQVTSTTYKKDLDDINKKINENNGWIKENVSEYEKQKIGIGGYSEGIKAAIKDTGIFNGTLGAMGNDVDGVISIVKSFTPILNNLKESFAEQVATLKSFKTSQAAANVETEAMTISAGALATAETITATETAVLASSTETLAAAEGVAAAETAVLAGETTALAGAQTVQATATTAAAGATGLLSAAGTVLKLVLQGLGIGLIIAAVVLLVTAFKNFTPLIDKVEQGMAKVGAVFNVVKNAVIALVTGAKSLGEVWSSLSGDMDEAADSAGKLKKAQQDLEDAMALQEVQSARNRAEINRLNIQAKDRTQTEEARLALLEKASKLEQSDYDQRKKNADEALRQAQEQIRIDAELTDAEFKQLQKQGLNYKEFVETKTSGVDELFEKLKDAQLKEIDLDNEYYLNLEKNINKQNKILEDKEKADADALKAREKAATDAVKAEADRQAKLKAALDSYTESLRLNLQLYLQTQGVKAKSVDEEIKRAERVRDESIKIAQAEFNASKKTANDKLKLQVATNQAAMDFMDAQTEAVVKNADKEFEAIVAANKSKLDNNKFLNDAMVQQEIDRLNRIGEAEKDNTAVRLEAAKASQEEINTALAGIDAENQIKKNEIAKQRKEAEQAAELIDLENKRILAGETFQYDLAAQQQQYDAQRAIEREDAIKRGADMALFDAVTAQNKKDIDRSVFLNKLELAENTYNGIAAILGKESSGGKALAIAQTTIDTYQSATAAFKALAGIPIVGPALGAVAAAGAVGTGLANVRKIASTKTPKMAKGGLISSIGSMFGIGGKRHSQGGTLFTGSDGTRFEAEQGEIIGVMNRNAAAMFMDFNNAFPAGSSSVPVSNYLEAGGAVSRNSQPTVDYDLFAAKIGAATAAANANLPAPVVSVKDISSEVSKTVIVNESTNF